jgi:hypothetical protein
VKQQTRRQPAAQYHPLVRSYLRDLRVALRQLSPDRARELGEQIRAHLEESVPPDADAQAVTDTLRRLGTPGQLAGPSSPSARHLSSLGAPPPARTCA